MTRFISATYHPNIKVAEFIADDGRHLLRSGGSLPWRTNNIGNLVSPVVNGTPSPKKTKGYIGFAKPASSDHHFFIFPDYVTGRAQLKANLLRLHKDKPLDKLIAAYAPKHDGNDTDGYTRKLSKLTGVDTDSKVNDMSDEQLESLMDGIARLEGYHADIETRKEVWVNVSKIQATDGTRPIEGEEIVLRTNGKETTLKSSASGQFSVIPHGKEELEVLHKTADGRLKKVGTLTPDTSQNWSLLTKLSEFFGTTAPVKAPADTLRKRQPAHYVVQPGDSLSKIARKFNTTVADLKKANRLTKDTIWPGQILGICGPASKSTATPQPVRPPTPTRAGKAQTHVGTTNATPARSKHGDGEPLALFKPTQQTAPWMVIAFREAISYAGKDEREIGKSKNYHRLVTESDRSGGRVIELKAKNGKVLKDKDGKIITKTRFDGAGSMVNTPWCASFVNFCLIEAHYTPGRKHMSSYTFGEDKDLFVRVKKPIYGAIRFSSRSGGGHVCFVYGRIGKKLVILGGNQSDQICFQLRDEAETASYFVPAIYSKFANTPEGQVLPEINIAELRKTFGSSVTITDAALIAKKTTKGSES